MGSGKGEVAAHLGMERRGRCRRQPEMGEKRAPPAPGPATREVGILLLLPSPPVVLQERSNCAWETQPCHSLAARRGEGEEGSHGDRAVSYERLLQGELEYLQGMPVNLHLGCLNQLPMMCCLAQAHGSGGHQQWQVTYSDLHADLASANTCCPSRTTTRGELHLVLLI